MQPKRSGGPHANRASAMCFQPSIANLLCLDAATLAALAASAVGDASTCVVVITFMQCQTCIGRRAIVMTLGVAKSLYDQTALGPAFDLPAPPGQYAPNLIERLVASSWR